MLLGAICGLSFLVYSGGLHGQYTNWDDQKYVFENPVIISPDQPALRHVLLEPMVANYHPVTMVSLLLNYRLSPDEFGFHLGNLLLHLLNVCLVFGFIYLLASGDELMALSCSLLFAVHPMHVESVTWISARKDVLFLCFSLVGLIVYLLYLRRQNLPWLIAVFGCFALSVLSKPSGVVFPFLLLLCDYLMKRKFNLAVFYEKIPFFLGALVMGLVTLRIQEGSGALFVDYNLLQKFSFASHSLLRYIGLLFCPINLSALHPYPDLSAGLPLTFLVAPAVLLLIAGSAFWWHRQRAVVFGVLFYMVSIALVLQVIAVGNAIIAERYVYLPYLGLYFILAYAWRQAVGRWGKPALLSGSVLLVSAAALCAVSTSRRVKVWDNSGTLWSDVIERYPESDIAWYNRGHYYGQKNEHQQAIRDFSQTINLRPRRYTAWHNRGHAYRGLKQYDLALADYSEAIKINPSLPEAYAGRGVAYLETDKFDAAISDFRQILQLDPVNQNAIFNMANALFKQKKLSEALTTFNRLLVLNPRHADGYYNRSVTYGNMGDRKQALTDALKAQQLGKPISDEYMRWLTAE